MHDTAEYFDHPYFRARRENHDLYSKRCLEIFNHIAKAIDINGIRGERMLDVGCDVGSLLVAAAEHYGIIPLGLDVAFRAVQGARSRGLQVFHGTIEQAPAEFSEFKIVTAVDILEHTADPSAFLRTIHKRMTAGGVLYIQTPNCDSTIYGVGRRLSKLTNGRPRSAIDRLFPAQHIQYFSRRGLQLLAERSGFRVADVKARILPAADIVTSRLVRSGLMVLQAIDSFRGKQILLCAVFKKC